MCFGSGTPSYTKKDYGPLPSLGTGRTDETPIAPTAVEAPVTRGSGGGGSSALEEVMARARASRSTGSVRPVARGQSQKRSLVQRGMMAVRYPTGRG